jgi:predicted RNA binding protein YcfA (HicA-like mRNA interferase family)
MRSFKQIASLVRGEDILEEGKKSLGTGWMLKADPKLGKAVKDKIDLAKKRQATYGDKSAGKSIKEEETIEEAGLWDNIHAKRERIKSGSGERMRKPGSEGAPSEKDLKNSQTNEEVELVEAEAKDYHSVHVNGRHWKTFDTKSHAENVAKKVKGATVHKYDAERLQQNYGAKAAARNAARGKQWDESVEVVVEGAPIVVALAPIDVRNPKKASQSYRNQGDIVPPTKPPSTEKRGVKGRPGQRPMPTHEEVEQLDEMPGANMDTRAVHQHLKKRGWKLSRTSGSHDVYTHPEAKHHIPVPRHRQLKAPLVKGILKQAEINEQAESDTTEKNEMVESQLHFIKYACDEILEYIEMGGEIEEWYQVKVAKSFSEFESLHAFMEGESRRLGMKEEVEQIDELSKKTLGSYVNKAMDSARELPGAGTNAEASKKTKRYAAVSAAAYRTQGLAPRKGIDMFRKYKAESVVAAGSDDKEPFDYDEWKKSTRKPRQPRGRKDAEALGQAIDREQSELRKRKEQGVAEEVGQTSNSNENPDAGRFASGPAKKPMKPAPIITAEQTATDLGKERQEVPFDGPYAKNTTKVTTDKSGAKHTAMSRVKHLAKTAARKQAGLKEEQEPEDSYEKTSTPARRSLSKTAGIVKDLAKNSKSSSKEKADTFQAEPELSSQIIKT